MSSVEQDKKEALKQYKKRYNEANKELNAIRRKQYNIEYHKLKTKCGCGSIYRKTDKARHEKSARHIKYSQQSLP
jgi:hypothetical protein